MKTLWLTPTAGEREIIAVAGLPDVRVTGFGLAAAGAVAATLIARHRPQSVGLIGIAGSLSTGAVVGRAYEFGVVRCDGIGAGEGDQYLSAEQMDWSHVDGEPPIGDLIQIGPSKHCLLSVTAASGDQKQADRRRGLFEEQSQVVAEDMEAFSVAIACQLAGKPLRIVRGISNHAGDRDRSGWQVVAALNAAVRLC